MTNNEDTENDIPPHSQGGNACRLCQECGMAYAASDDADMAYSRCYGKPLHLAWKCLEHGVDLHKYAERILKMLALSLVILTMPVHLFAYKAGDTITFGSYPYEKNGTEKPIEWYILNKYEDGTALIMSTNVLDARQYHDKFASVTWEESDLRKWLNKDFLNIAFTAEERDRIIESKIENNDNASYKTRGGKDTYDKLFILSIEEAKKYHEEYGIPLEAYPTPYADKYLNMKGDSWYWLRTPGRKENRAACVDPKGDIDAMGDVVADEARPEDNRYARSDVKLGVRPVLKIKLKEYLDLSQLKEGDIIGFGRYWNKGADKNKKLPKPIEWKVLAVEGDTALIVSQKRLSSMCDRYDEIMDLFYEIFDEYEHFFIGKAYLGDGDEEQNLIDNLADLDIAVSLSEFSGSGKLEYSARMALWLDLDKIAEYNNVVLGKDNKAYLGKKYEYFENSQHFELENLKYESYPDRDRLIFNLCSTCDINKQRNFVLEQQEDYPDQFIVRIKGVEVKKNNKVNKKKLIKNVVISSVEDKTKIRIDKGKNGGRVYVKRMCSNYSTFSCKLLIDVFKLKGQTQEEWFKDYSVGKDYFEYDDPYTEDDNEENIRNIKKIIRNDEIVDYVEE